MIRSVFLFTQCEKNGEMARPTNDYERSVHFAIRKRYAHEQVQRCDMRSLPLGVLRKFCGFETPKRRQEQSCTDATDDESRKKC